MLSLTWERYPRWLYTGFQHRIFLLSPLWIRGACTSCKTKKPKPIILDYWAGHLKGKRSNYWRKIKIFVGQFGTFSWNMWSLDLFCNSKEWISSKDLKSWVSTDFMVGRRDSRPKTTTSTLWYSQICLSFRSTELLLSLPGVKLTAPHGDGRLARWRFRQAGRLQAVW